MCAASSAHFKSLQELARHITTVHVFDIVCLWDGCVFGLSQADAREMETHMLKHVYMTHIFNSFKEWCESLPSGYVDSGSTDLRLCPPALRCHFDLLLLNETLDIHERYTLIDHQMYLFIFKGIIQTSILKELKVSSQGSHQGNGF
ncbi:uncharacterized protein LOC117319385 [Pecten maximus]|uniref:uncharacterized protein LOC117319385 n=1 Tax=Pecten maximus TaxID=6579 RepID=UPI00145900BA|nr:uncharacterized protein LOC117319385 [Pecten maximus]